MDSNICHITSAHKCSDTRIFHKECKSLSKIYDVMLICFGDNVGVQSVEGVTISCLGRSYKSRIKRFVLGSIKIYSASKKAGAKIYHFHDPELIFVGLCLKMSGKKVIYDVHEDLPKQIYAKTWIPKCLRRIMAFLVKIVEVIATKLLDAVIVVIDSQKERFAKYSDNVIELANYPLMSEVDKFMQKDDSREDRSICYVGGITIIRGIQQMVSITKKTNCNLLIAGPFESSDLLKQVENMDGWSNVCYLGNLNREDIVNLLSKSNIGLGLFHPTLSYIDGDRPVKMYEYMAAGIPVLMSNFPKIAEFIERTNCGLTVNPLDEQEIVEKINWFFDNPQEMKRMGMNGRRAVIEKYNWDIEEKKLLALYKKLIEE